MWWKGPPWFTEEIKDEWNSSNLINEVTTNVTVSADKLPVANSALPDAERYNSLSKLLRVTSYVRRLIGTRKFTDLHISASEIQEALLSWIKEVQRMSYDKEIAF